MQSCFFIGHREADERLLPYLTEAIRRLVSEENVRYFFVGGYGGFDRIAGMAVKVVKKQHPDITVLITRKDWRVYQSNMQLSGRTSS